MTVIPIVPCYFLVFTLHQFINHIFKDKIITTYALSIFINTTYLFAVSFSRFQPSYNLAVTCMNLLIAYYAFDTNRLLYSNDATTSDKVTYIPHHIVSIALIGGQIDNLYPMQYGMWFLTFFELSNVFLLIFQVANKKKCEWLKKLVAYPFVLTYIPLRGVVIPIYSLKFVPYLMLLSSKLCVLYSLMFLFIDMFSLYFAIVVLQKFIKHCKK